jgi:hypothetical protein
VHLLYFFFQTLLGVFCFLKFYLINFWLKAIAINQDLGRYPDFPHGAWRIVGDALGSTSGISHPSKIQYFE